MTHLAIRPFNVNEVAAGDTWEGMYGLETKCRTCGSRADIINRHWDDPLNGTVGNHSRSEGGRLCDGVGVATDLETAIRRDSRLNEDEARAHSRTWHYLNSCQGHWRGTDEFCGHPKCGRLLDLGKRWTLMGWQ
ncbi:hypothetical protein [Streptomyces zaomyceticus]|uniref:hypothetical protein n=1 Tax=Streptomyces zaomyceticus TaxID=68286 RepID=UPI003418C826